MEMKKLRKYKKNNAGIWKMWEEKSQMEKTNKKKTHKEKQTTSWEKQPKSSPSMRLNYVAGRMYRHMKPR